MEKGEIIKAKDGKPFESLAAAKMRQGQIRGQKGLETEPIEMEGGYGLQVTGDASEPESKKLKPRKLKKRVPIGSRAKLRYPKREGYHRRVVNDVDDRVQRFLDAGYSIVEGEMQGSDPRAGEATQMGKTVAKPVGQGIRGVLMELPDNFYEEDQAAKQAQIQKTEEGMRRRAAQGDDEMYGEVKIQ